MAFIFTTSLDGASRPARPVRVRGAGRAAPVVSHSVQWGKHVRIYKLDYVSHLYFTHNYRNLIFLYCMQYYMPYYHLTSGLSFPVRVSPISVIVTCESFVCDLYRHGADQLRQTLGRRLHRSLGSLARDSPVLIRGICKPFY